MICCNTVPRPQRTPKTQADVRRGQRQSLPCSQSQLEPSADSVAGLKQVGLPRLIGAAWEGRCPSRRGRQELGPFSRVRNWNEPTTASAHPLDIRSLTPARKTSPPSSEPLFDLDNEQIILDAPAQRPSHRQHERTIWVHGLHRSDRRGRRRSQRSAHPLHDPRRRPRQLDPRRCLHLVHPLRDHKAGAEEGQGRQEGSKEGAEKEVGQTG
ncbi:hypothetical protein B0T11DRAFT_144525 [Plectosphaerella cucumerina]|uniref:Uncharacterized protein n=1 Tax=Plectosphaerella cucumerina TaxID=40658 RepID=A0A8K0TAT4_9PEZI|nr:hypothetical protein B0T11DRAFT_144525 [Plectosphaerella cucumerina]